MLDRDTSAWAIRMFLGREPASVAEIDLHRQHASAAALRAAFARAPEVQAWFRSSLPAIPPAAAPAATPSSYRVPLFLLEPPASPDVPWRFASPSLAEPTSQLCTHGQLTESLYGELCRALDNPSLLHRKYWEHAYIIAALRHGGALAPGSRALGFGVGTEHTPAYLAGLGIAVTATDAPPEVIAGVGWGNFNQHASERAQLFYPKLVDQAAFDRLLSYRAVDMNNIPGDLRDFDFCWSSCALEHLGSLRHGLDFVANSLKTLRIGGLAVHTTEFNLSSNDATLEAPTLSIYRKRDIVDLLARLVADGQEVWPLNLHPGSTMLDEHIDAPPWALPHLKLQMQSHTITSIGIVVRRRR